MAKDGGVHYPNPFNETGSKDPNQPDVNGDGLYYDGWSEVMKMHLSTNGADMVTSDNADASHDVYGGPTAGEPNPGMWGGKGGGK